MDSALENNQCYTASEKVGVILTSFLAELGRVADNEGTERKIGHVVKGK